MELNRKYFNQRKWHFDELPLTIMIETAMACNLRCEMCPVPKSTETMDGRKPSIMSFDIYNKILHQLSQQKRIIYLNQMGEPLLNKHICEFVSIAKKYNHSVFITTNGTLMNTRLAKELLTAGLDGITFSVDGFSPDTYERIRIGANYESVRNNIESFCDLKKLYNKGTWVQIDCILSDLTKNEIPLMQKYWKNKIDHFNTIPLDDWAGKLKLPTMFGNKNWKKKTLDGLRYPCDLLWTTMSISAEGKAIYCCHDYKLQSNLPNVIDVPLKVIQKDYLSKERKKHVENKIDEDPCLHCCAWQTRDPYFRENWISVLSVYFPQRLKQMIKRLIA